MKHWLIALTLLMTGLLPLHAQEERPAPSLSVGDVVENRITDEQFEIFYTVQGEAGSVIIFELTATEDRSELSGPEMILYDADGRQLLDTLDHFGAFQEAKLVLELPDTGTYELLVTRSDGRAGDSVGDFRLRVISPVRLLPGDTYDDAALNNATLNYYIVQEDTPFSVFYEFSNGEMDPFIVGYAVAEGELDEAARLSGSGLISGSIGLRGGDASIHIITVGDSPFASYFDDRVERADYRLRLLVSE